MAENEFVGTGRAIGPEDIETAAATLRCEAAAVKAVIAVEAGSRGFLPDKRPKILFEAHVFSRQTGHRFDQRYPNISSRRWNRSLYGRAGAHQYERLAIAMGLDRAAALKAASWGAFQILGVNHSLCGFEDVDGFVRFLVPDEGRQLEAFVRFVQARGLDAPLRERRWADFARGYNGSGYRQNRYDEKLAQAFARHLSGDTPADHAASPGLAHEAGDRLLQRGDRGDDVRALQRELNALGADPPVDVDGIFGPGTEQAVRLFQASVGLAVDGLVGPRTWFEINGEGEPPEDGAGDAAVGTMTPAARLAGHYDHYDEVDAEAWAARWPNFTPREIACRGGGSLLVDEDALDRLQDLRDRIGRPMVVNSGYRSPEHNHRVGGAAHSRHMQGIAFDIGMAGHDPRRFVRAARACGFRGFGFYRGGSFIHIDTRQHPAEWGKAWW